MKVIYFGSYKESYPRNKIIIDGLRENGVTVIECNDNSSSIFLKFFRLAVKFYKIRSDYDFMIVAFPGQEVMFLAKLISRKPVVFDVFTSHYMGYILDRKYFSENSWRAKYYRFLDTWSCRLADIIFLDTQAHIDYFVKEFNLPAGKFRRIWLGANPDLHHPRIKQNQGMFSALFWGNFIPLQGVEHIIRAAKILENEPIIFNLSGRGQTYESNKKLAEELNLKNVNFLGKTTDEELVQYIQETDICLGTYSDGVKADITIQNKIFESLASKRTIITEKTSSIQELLNDGQGVLWCNKADPKDLAEKILILKNNKELNDKIAEEGYKLFLEKLTPYKIGQDFVKILA